MSAEDVSVTDPVVLSQTATLHPAKPFISVEFARLGFADVIVERYGLADDCIGNEVGAGFKLRHNLSYAFHISYILGVKLILAV